MPSEIGAITVSGSSSFENGQLMAVGQTSNGKPVKTIYEGHGSQQEQELVQKMNSLVSQVLAEGGQSVTKVEIRESQILITESEGSSVHVVQLGQLSLQEQELVKDISDLAKSILLVQSSSSPPPEVQVGSPLELVVSQEVTIQEALNSPKKSEKTKQLEAIEQNFSKKLEQAKDDIAYLQAADKWTSRSMLRQVQEKYVDLESIVQDSKMSEAEKYQKIQELRAEYAAKSLELKNTVDHSQSIHFTEVETSLHEMTKEYNQIVDLIEQAQVDRSVEGQKYLKKLEGMRDKMHASIQECNQEMNERSLTTHPATINKSHIMSLAAVVEKKLTLHETVYKPKKGIRDFLKALSANKQLGQGVGRLGMFKTAPSHTALVGFIDKLGNDIGNGGIAEAIRRNISTSNQEYGQSTAKSKHLLPCFAKAKDAYKFQKETFEWGQEYLNVAVTAPANWTIIRKATVKESGSGRMYVTGTENKPLNITEKGGVPAGLRKANGYRDRATNLIQTTSYVLSDDGTRQVHDISFRGGQFPTVAAAKEAIKAMIDSGIPLEQLHINALLTPMATVMGKGMPDRKLLVAHKENILKAMEELKAEYGNSVEYSKDELRHTKFDKLGKLQASFAMSNFGVNEGAVGQLKKKGVRLQWLVPGWHTSIREYSNDASKQLTQSLNKALTSKERLEEYDPNSLDKLGAIVQVGQEMEAVWATNSYAEAGVGNNQFKLPALWKTMDALVGVTCYTDCMSGKDRTGKVESHAQSYLDEIAMNTTEHKKRLDTEFTRIKEGLPEDLKEEWEAERKYLTAACFTTEDLNNLASDLKQEGYNLKAMVRLEIENKMTRAKEALGLIIPEDELMAQKTMEGSTWNKLGTSGISKTVPKLSQKEHQTAAQNFPRLAATTIFSGYELDWDAGATSWEDKARAEGRKIQAEYVVSKGALPAPLQGEDAALKIGYTRYLDHYRKKHTEAANSRNSQIASLNVTQMNTGKPGFKVEGGEPLARATCGFDRDYVLLTLVGKMKSPQFTTQRMESEFVQLVGLNEFDQDTRDVLLEHFHAAGGDIDKHLSLIKEIEHAKMETFFPQARVKA